MSRSLTVYVLCLGGAASLVILTLLAPWLAARDSSAAQTLYHAFSSVCHQIPARSFHLFGHPLAVCGRCFGIYVGLLCGSLIYPLILPLSSTRLPRPWVFPAFGAPLLLDVIAGLLGLWNSGLWLRSVSGLLWGGVLPFYILPAAQELSARLLAFRRTSK